MTSFMTMLPKWVPAKQYSKISGYSFDALKHKRNGHWIEGDHWRKGPDGVIYYNWHYIDEWVEHGNK